MKPTASKVDLEKLFPLLGVSDTGVAVSKKGAMTFGWEMSLPVEMATAIPFSVSLSMARPTASDMQPWFSTVPSRSKAAILMSFSENCLLSSANCSPTFYVGDIVVFLKRH